MDKEPFLRSFDKPHPANPYLPLIAEGVNAYGDDLWNNLHRVPNLEPSAGQAVLFCLLDFACQSQNMGNISNGRYGIGAIPREWVLANIEAVVEPILQTDDDWEWMRFLEICWCLDEALLQRVALRAASSENEGIREAGMDFVDTT